MAFLLECDGRYYTDDNLRWTNNPDKARAYDIATARGVIQYWTMVEVKDAKGKPTGVFVLRDHATVLGGFSTKNVKAVPYIPELEMIFARANAGCADDLEIEYLRAIGIRLKLTLNWNKRPVRPIIM